MQLTAKLLIAGTGCSKAKAALWLDSIAVACNTYGINSEARLCAFLAQIGHESGGLFYSREIWGNTKDQSTYERDFSQSWSAANARNKKAFRLGNFKAGDGRRFLGRGLIQVTGRANTAAFRDRIRKIYPEAPDFEATPALLESTQWAALSAGDYWDSRDLNALADKGDFEAITRAINGGLNGFADRLRLYAKAKDACNG